MNIRNYKFILSTLFIGLISNGFTQTFNEYTSKIPEGYQLLDVNHEEGSKISVDLDKDGIKDLAIIYTKQNFESAILVIYLSSSFSKDNSYQWCEWFHMINDFNYTNNILNLSSIDMGKFTTEINLKYNIATKKMMISNYNEDGINKKPNCHLNSN